MGKTAYVAREPDRRGHVRYSAEEHAVWADLYARQRPAIEHKACDEFMRGLELLKLPHDHIPQLQEVSTALRRETGWSVVPVPALIPFERFFQLLADRQFPAATFVRRRESLDYLQEPDIFHELFGHAPLLTQPHFAEFTRAYGRLGLAARPEERVHLERLYWFTVEFGLVHQPGAALRIYGGGILSSIGETSHALSDAPQRRRFDLLEVLRRPYRIDIMQPLYYVIEDFRQLFDFLRDEPLAKLAEARRLGSLPPLFGPAPGVSCRSIP